MLIIPLAFAFEEGDIYSQAQVDSADFDSFDYNTIQCRSENTVFFAGGSINHIYSCLNLHRMKNMTYYIVERDYYFATIPLWLLDWCRDEYGWQVCAEHYNGFLQNPGNQFGMYRAERIIQNLKGYQQSDLDPGYREWLENRELFP